MEASDWYKRKLLSGGYQYTWDHISMCLIAAVTDMLTTLIMLFGFGLFYKNIFWSLKLNLSKILLIILTGGTGTVLLERRHSNGPLGIR